MILYINGNYPYHSLHSELVYKLAEMGNEIIVFAPMRGKNGYGLFPCDHPRVRVIYSDCLNYADKVVLIHKTRKIAKVIEQQVDMSKVDCMLAGTVYSDGMVAYQLHQKYHIPFSVAVRGTDISFQMKFRPYLNAHIKKLLHHTAKIIFLTPAFMKRFSKFGNDQTKYIIIPNAVNDYWFQQQKQKRNLHEPRSIIFVGEITKNKNVRTTIKAISELNKRNFKVNFHIVGSGAEEANCRALAKELNIEEQIFFHGWQKGKEKIKEIYDKADLFVMPSLRETFGTVYIEALSQGIPVIYSRGQGIDGYFEQGVIGYSCNPTDTIDIVNAIQKIVEDYSAFSDRCVIASRRFQWKEVAKQYDQVLSYMREK